MYPLRLTHRGDDTDRGVRLWLPKREDLRVIESIPTLGSGKVDLRAVKQLAVEVAT